MRFFNLRRTNHVSPTRNSRRIRPTVEGFESRLLLSTGTISGTVLRDVTGNGNSSDDARLAGVTVNLYQKGSSTVLENATTDSKGNYSFANLPTGNYSVQQVVPANFLPTEALNGHSVSLGSGQTAGGRDFDDFDTGLYSTSTISNVHYTVTTPDGRSVTHPTTLSGNVQQGDTVNVHFQLSKPEMVELVAYVSPDGGSDTSSLQQQVVFDCRESSTTASGAQTVTVTVPNGYFQLDFVAGPVIDHLAGNANVSYAAQGRVIDTTLGGTQVNGTSTLSGSVDVINSAGQKVGLDIPNGVELILTGYSYTGKAVKETTTTDANGNYTFTNLVASGSGGYRIAEVVPQGYVQVGAKFINTFLNTNSTSTRNDFLDAPSTS